MRITRTMLFVGLLLPGIVHGQSVLQTYEELERSCRRGPASACDQMIQFQRQNKIELKKEQLRRDCDRGKAAACNEINAEAQRQAERQAYDKKWQQFDVQARQRMQEEQKQHEQRFQAWGQGVERKALKMEETLKKNEGCHNLYTQAMSAWFVRKNRAESERLLRAACAHGCDKSCQALKKPLP